MTNTTLPLTALGDLNAQHIFYLPTPPILPIGKLTTQSLIEVNGNHWRKILTIIAKLMCKEDDWKTLRDTRLLDEVGFYFGDALQLKPQRQHYVCGKAHWDTLKLTPSDDGFISCDETGKAWRMHGKNSTVWLLPYPDYRQFNNALVALVKQC